MAHNTATCGKGELQELFTESELVTLLHGHDVLAAVITLGLKHL
jgi:hypothetical protein